jgi:hypothetical protein
MHRNLYRLWVVLVLISGGIALWFSGAAIMGIVKFSLLNAQTSAEIIRWQVCEVNSSRFAVEAHYLFTVGEKSYIGKTKFESPQFLNRYAAENYIATLGSKQWKTWYRQSSPACSSLERQFPQKKCLQSVLTLGVFIYFFFARSLVMRAMGSL